jgi:hypothetical protein
MAYDKDNSGSLSKNTRKEKDTHPDIRGKCKIAGVEYWIDGWQKDGESGKWYSLSFKPKDARPAQPAPQEPRQQPGKDFDDDLPF